MKRIAFFIVSLYCLTACDNMVLDGPNINDPVIIPDETPRIQLFFPEEEVVNVYSTATTYENTIDYLWVLSFDAVTGVLDTLELIDVAKIVKNGYATQLLPQLSFTPTNDHRIVCIAGSRTHEPAELTTLSAVTYSTINDKFLLDHDMYYHGDDTPLPMYGEFIWNPLNGYTCVMRRAVAKVQVQMGTSVSDVTGKFSAENIYYRVYNHGLYGLMQPNLSRVRGIPNPTRPLSGFFSTAEDHANKYKYYLMQNEEHSLNEHKHVYLHEYPSSNHTAFDTITSIDPKKFHAERQHIILTKVNEPGDTVYYRLDFYNPKDSTYFDTKRNHHYMFTINKVRSEGYRSIDEAHKNPGSNIVYEVRANDESKQIISNGQYAIVANLKDSVFPLWPDRTLAIGSARYHIPIEMSSPPTPPAPDTLFFEVTSVDSPYGYNSANPITVTPTSLPPSSSSSSFQPVKVYVPPLYGGATGFVVFQFGNITYKWPINFTSALM